MMPDVPRGRCEVLNTPYGPVLGTSCRWSSGQYCAVHTSRGFLGCGIYDIATAEEFGMAVAIAKGTPENPLFEPEDLFHARVVGVNGPARQLGIEPGMSGLDALARFLAEETSDG